MPSMKILLSASVLALAPFSAVAQDAEYTADTVLATVNGTDITLGHMLALRSRLPEQFQSIPDAQLYEGILEQLINQQALADELGQTPATLTLVLENERRAIMASERIESLLDEAMTDEALQEAYDARFADFVPSEEYNAAHILVETEEEAAALVTELEGGADFAELAKEKSTGPSGPNGGDLGWFGTGMMVPPFEAAVIELEAGDVSAPVQTQFGWHVILLKETRETTPPPLESVRQELMGEIRESVINTFVETARSSADVVIPEIEVPVEAISQPELLEN